ncbi:S8 family serine peptidase [Paenibacillus sp. GCM10023250]|uniref:S8 family serine peptidase n=1 Tax=Paenibacillus sp. GCM10023250 TaxID=3252648 RepID=UPI00360A7179
MEWPSVRNFLHIPSNLTGNNVSIAVVDGYFPPHPDITTNDRRLVYLVDMMSVDVKPELFRASETPWRSSHGLMTAAAAAGSGSLSSGYYSGAAPDAELYLLQTGGFNTVEDIETKCTAALSWIRENWRKFGIRGVVLTVASTRDTGLLPWQIDPIRMKCEQLAKEGLLVVVASGNTRELTCNGPASSPSVLAVGGVIVPHEGNQILQYHGCKGITFDGKRIPEILAPAENIVLPMPFQSIDEYRDHDTAPYDNLPEGYARTEGTSFAAPIILGCAACIWEAHSEWMASQVKTAMFETAIYKNEWYGSEAGLIQVGAAVSYSADAAIDNRRDDLEPIMTDELHLVSIIHAKHHKSSDEVKQMMFHSNSTKVRAAAICAMADSTFITRGEMEDLLRDPSCYVKMAALFALNNRADIWEHLLGHIAELFKDSDLDLSYCAIKLASRIEHPFFIEPLVSGLMNDAILQRVSTFGARCEALQRLTGIFYQPVPEFREGQCFYSERSTESRIHLALLWQQYITTLRV